MNSFSLTLLINAASTWFMVGLIWLIQVVHYPLFASVGKEQYQNYQSQHETLITWIVGPVMLVELVSAGLLLWFSSTRTDQYLAVVGLVLVVAIWLSTAFLQVPCHAQLATGFDETAHRQLVAGNWIRTIAWSARGLIVGWMLARLIQSSLSSFSDVPGS